MLVFAIKIRADEVIQQAEARRSSPGLPKKRKTGRSLSGRPKKPGKNDPPSGIVRPVCMGRTGQGGLFKRGRARFHDLHRHHPGDLLQKSLRFFHKPSGSGRLRQDSTKEEFSRLRSRRRPGFKTKSAKRPISSCFFEPIRQSQFQEQPPGRDRFPDTPLPRKPNLVEIFAQ